MKIILFLLPVFIVVVLVNVIVDSAFVFNKRSDEIATILISGKNVGIKYLPTEWGSLQVEIVEQRIKANQKKGKDIVVFGTSRSAEIHEDLFVNKSFFNCALPGGNILDYIALFELYRSNGFLPQYLIISIDPWTFHARKPIQVQNETFYITDLDNELYPSADLVMLSNKGIRHLGVNYNSDESNKFLEKFLDFYQLLSPGYFQLNIRDFNTPPVIFTDSFAYNSYFILRKDGSYSNNKQNKIDSVKLKSILIILLKQIKICFLYQ
ncbi:MAG: hypothetical protein HC905_23330 [Bacteroidales bacterium]|nr:hypothetical protein [Bacteroidales bacterium]